MRIGRWPVGVGAGGGIGPLRFFIPMRGCGPALGLDLVLALGIGFVWSYPWIAVPAWVVVGQRRALD